MKFKDYFSIKHMLFAVALFAILIPFAIRDSNNQVKVSFDDTSVYTSSNKYSLTVSYDQIDSVELAVLPEAGEKVEDGYDDDILPAAQPSALTGSFTGAAGHVAAAVDPHRHRPFFSVAGRGKDI